MGLIKLNDTILGLHGSADGSYIRITYQHIVRKREPIIDKEGNQTVGFEDKDQLHIGVTKWATKEDFVNNKPPFPPEVFSDHVEISNTDLMKKVINGQTFGEVLYGIVMIDERYKDCTADYES